MGWKRNIYLICQVTHRGIEFNQAYESKEEAQRMIDFYKEMYPGYVGTIKEISLILDNED